MQMMMNEAAPRAIEAMALAQATINACARCKLSTLGGAAHMRCAQAMQALEQAARDGGESGLRQALRMELRQAIASLVESVERIAIESSDLRTYIAEKCEWAAAAMRAYDACIDGNTPPAAADKEDDSEDEADGN